MILIEQERIPFYCVKLSWPYRCQCRLIHPPVLCSSSSPRVRGRDAIAVVGASSAVGANQSRDNKKISFLCRDMTGTCQQLPQNNHLRAKVAQQNASLVDAIRNKCIASSNRCLTSSNKKLLDHIVLEYMTCNDSHHFPRPSVVLD